MTIDASSPPALARFVRDQRRGVVATVSAAGHPEAALVGLTALDDGTLIFDSHQSFRKVANLQAASTVAVVVGLDGQVSVQVEGTARIAVAPDERRIQRSRHRGRGEVGRRGARRLKRIHLSSGEPR
ncbi:pyridoxamine 5'-phosphate oxidase family protein [Branchiibius hedensis]|uniref:pyridoxamine 5'-phosphate oxidase family protein n=1 Tax=Branchiibius hedensis TaxID=672460 RepID=UPI000D6C04BA|nr:pyridoxamine 5'-phosphate oxidase family protein [Branchiibius hedensis]